MLSTNGHGSKPERIALYLRVSSEEQRDRETIQIQREFLEQYCRLYELDVADVYEDDGISGTIPSTRGRRAGGSKRTPERASSRSCSSPSSTGSAARSWL